MQRFDGLGRGLERVWRGCVLHLVLVSSAVAQDAERLTQGRDIVTMPSIGRVILAFLLTAGIAVAVAYALRRYSPKFAAGLVQGSSLRVIDRLVLNGGLRLHVVEVSGEKILVAENRAGVSTLRLGASDAPRSEQT